MNILELGIERGEALKVLSLVRKKHSKGCSASVIADALEESEEYISSIVQVLEAHPDWTDIQLLNHLNGH